MERKPQSEAFEILNRGETENGNSNITDMVVVIIKEAVEKFGRVDAMVSNAGIMPIAPMNLLKVDEWDRQIDLNVINIKGALYGVAAALC
jgi:NADP-dependent 3-hydroxy acid dehydrogenase YdfG